MHLWRNLTVVSCVLPLHWDVFFGCGIDTYKTSGWRGITLQIIDLRNVAEESVPYKRFFFLIPCHTFNRLWHFFINLLSNSDSKLVAQRS